MSAEADLWAAVFKRAIDDACGAESVRRASKESSAAPTARDVREAWAFLTDGNGEWGDNREFWTTMNGLNPGILREEALRRGLSRAARVALVDGECKAPSKPRPEIVRLPRAAAKERNERLLRDYMDGVPTDIIGRRYGVKPATVHTIAERAGVHRSLEVRAQYARESGRRAHEHLADRNAEIIERAARGQTQAVIAREMGISAKAVHALLTRQKKKTASAVEVRGDGNSRAGGGVGVNASFHVQSMEEATR